MKSKALKLVLATGLFLLSALSLQASVESILNLDVKCYYQAKYTSDAENNWGKVNYVRLDSKHLVYLIGKARGTSFPDGAQLKVMVDGRVFVVTSDGYKITNVTNLVEAKLGVQKRLFHGTHNNQTGQETSRSYFPISLTINLPQLKVVLDGIGTEDFQATEADQDGIQIKMGTINCNVSGTGSVNGKLGYYDGRMELEGRKAAIVR
jgi:hypothetical protein